VRIPLTLLLLVLPALVGCADVRAPDDDRSGAEPLATGTGDDQAIRLCLDLARLEAAVEAGSPSTAAESAQELLARAPEDLRTDARRLAERLRGAPAMPGSATDDPEVRDLTARLRAAADAHCEPGDDRSAGP
jgi:hypothetical protein